VANLEEEEKKKKKKKKREILKYRKLNLKTPSLKIRFFIILKLVGSKKNSLKEYFQNIS